MRFSLLLFIILLAAESCAQIRYHSGNSVTAAEAVQKLGHRFLRFDPLKADFRTIVNDLFADTTIHIDTVIASTDTSRLYIRGYHSSFNPWHIPLDSVRTIISEHRKKDSRTPDAIGPDRILLLQTEGIAVGVERIANLKLAFDSLERFTTNRFPSSYYGKSKKGKTWIGENVTYQMNPPSPMLNITWRKRDEEVAIICISFYLELTAPL